MEIGEYERMFAVEADHFWYRTLHGHVLKLLKPEAPHATILDAGCGTGMLAWRLTDAGFAVTGLDFSPEALRLAKTRGLENLIEGSVNALPFPDNIVSMPWSRWMSGTTKPWTIPKRQERQRGWSSRVDKF